MLRRYRQILEELFRLADLVVVLAAWFGSYWSTFHWFGITQDRPPPPLSGYAALAPVVAILWLTTFTLSGVYESRRLRGRKGEVLMIWKAHAISLLLLTTMVFAYEEYRYSRLVLLAFGVIAAVGLAISRVALRTALRALRASGRNLRHVLIVGEGTGASRLAQRLSAYPELGLRVRGLVTSNGAPSSQNLPAPVLGEYDELLELLRSTRVDEVLFALPNSEQPQLTEMLRTIQHETVDIRVLPDVQEYVTFSCEVEELDGLPILILNDVPRGNLQIALKRMMDLAVSAIGLVVVGPLLLAIGLGVKLTSPGPVLFSQERMGLDGRTFRMLKFRSMRVDAEAQSGAVWAKANDDRRTAFGSFLRRTSLDELPQLWNVLVGDMSLVGPRPERPVFVEQFRHEIEHYMLRHKVKAGITGWAQVNGLRGNTSLTRRIEYDLHYIRNWSLLYDVRILVMTVWKGFVHENAY